MIAFLKKVRAKTLFSILDPIKVEPLELCYLESVLLDMSVETYIIDDLFKLKRPPNVVPDMIVLTGYNTAENDMIHEAKKYKTKYPNAKIIIGGVHAQLNSTAFHKEELDYVIHSQSLSIFKDVVKNIIGEKNTPLYEGVDYTDSDKKWHKGNTYCIVKNENYKASRLLFHKIKNQTSYLDKINVALIKGSTGCPFNCAYCYCKCLNNGFYLKNDYQKMVGEMTDISADYYWIVDDVLFVSRQDALDFIEAVDRSKLNLKIIGYLRADFILQEKDLLSALKKAGLCEVIIGFESPDNEELKGYHKAMDSLNYPEVIKLLKLHDIDFTALFMVKPDYTIKNFANLYSFIKKQQIEVYTISIFTPIKGTSLYEDFKKDLITENPKHFDFLHLVLKPKLPLLVFYFLFYCLHLRLLKSKRIWKYVFNKFQKKRY